MNDSVSFGTLNYFTLLVYLSAMVFIGVWMARRQKTTEDYFVGGRQMPWFVVGLSILASLLSAISYLGIPATAFQENISLIAGYLAGPFGALLLIFLFYPFYHRLRVTTSYEYVGRRFGQSGRFVVSGLFVLARLGWLGAVIYGPALALSAVTGIRLELAILLMGVLATSYTALGGMSAVLWTDVVQFVILFGGGLWVTVSLISSVPGGLSSILQIAEETDHLAGFDWSLSLTQMSAGMAMVSLFLFCIQDYGTDQVTIQRIMSVRTFAGKAKAVLLNSLLDILFVGMLLFIGVALFAYSQTHPGWLSEDMKLDQLLPYYIMTALPEGISGLVITAIFAAAMSSMDSGIHSVSTVVINDFVRPLRKRPASDRSDLFLARVLVAALGFSATLAAFWVSRFEHILEAAYVIVGSFNGPILALFMLGVLTRRAHFLGWCLGMVVGLGFVFYLMWHHEDVHFLYYFPTSFGLTLIIGYLLSLVVSRPQAEAALTIWGRRAFNSAQM